MAHPAGEAETGDLRVDFDRRLRLEFHGSRITSDAGLLAFRELDDALGLTGMAGDALADSRTGRNSRHSLMAQFRQSVFGRLAGYEDVNDADRLGVDPAMRWIVGGQAVMGQAASTSQMGRFETEVLAKEANVTALADLSGRWIDVVHARLHVDVAGQPQSFPDGYWDLSMATMMGIINSAREGHVISPAEWLVDHPEPDETKAALIGIGVGLAGAALIGAIIVYH